MRLFALFFLCLASLLAGCLGLKPGLSPPGDSIVPMVHDSSAMALRVDSVRVVTPRSWLQKAGARVGIHQAAAETGRIGKKSTVSYYFAPATIITAGKKAAVADGDHAVALERPQGQLVQGNDNATSQPVAGAPPSALTIFARIKLFLANAAQVLILVGIALLILAILFRKRLIPGFPI